MIRKHVYSLGPYSSTNPKNTVFFTRFVKFESKTSSDRLNRVFYFQMLLKIEKSRDRTQQRFPELLLNRDPIFQSPFPKLKRDFTSMINPLPHDRNKDVSKSEAFADDN